MYKVTGQVFEAIDLDKTPAQERYFVIEDTTLAKLVVCITYFATRKTRYSRQSRRSIEMAKGIRLKEEKEDVIPIP